ncbi:hypothetical protein BH09ACT5_BH09ACT5_00140 [soil metagenome]
MPVPTTTPSPTVAPPTMRPLPGTDFMLDQVEATQEDARVPAFRFAAAHIAGEGEDFSFTLPEGTWLVRVSCATDASDTVDATLDFADGRPSVEYQAYCGETPPSGIVTVTTQSPEFAAGGAVTLRLESDARFVAAAGLVQVG